MKFRLLVRGFIVFAVMACLAMDVEAQRPGGGRPGGRPGAGGPGAGRQPGGRQPGGRQPGGRQPGGNFGSRFGRAGSSGEIMSRSLQDQLKMTDKQKKEIEELQKEVTAKIEKILTEEQRTSLKQIRERGSRFGSGGPGGGRRPGAGGPGGGRRPGAGGPGGSGGRPGGRPSGGSGRPDRPPQ